MRNFRDRGLRERQALRQEDLAELAGVGKNTVRKLAQAFGVDPAELVE